MGQSMVLTFFGGVSQDGFSWQQDFDKVLFELARWLLPIGICLLAQGAGMERQKKIEMLSGYRYETIGRWWRHKYARGMRSGLLAAAVLFLPAMAADMSRDVFPADKAWRVFVLWLVHIVTIMSVFLVLDLTRYRRLAPALLLVLEGFTFLIGYQSVGAGPLMYGMWGMYFQSEWNFGETGFFVPAALAAEGILLAFSYLAGGVCLKSREYGFSKG